MSNSRSHLIVGDPVGPRTLVKDLFASRAIVLANPCKLAGMVEPAPSAAPVPHAIIVFDGVCVLCSGGVRFLLPRDRAGRFRFAAMQSETGRRLLAEHGLDPGDPVSFLLLEGGRAYTDSNATLRILVLLGGWWRLAAALYAAPRPLRDAVYRFVARRRYRWFGQRETCFVPTAETAGRFLR
jgi:predicted DCC family thiol-disulfide oxidoreductase YuxK